MLKIIHHGAGCVSKGELSPRHLRETLGARKQQGHPVSMVRKMARRTHAATAVAAAARRNENGPLPGGPCKPFKRRFREVSAGVFHHLKEVGTGFFNCNAVQLLHPGGSDRRYGASVDRRKHRSAFSLLDVDLSFLIDSRG